MTKIIATYLKNALVSLENVNIETAKLEIKWALDRMEGKI